MGPVDANLIVGGALLTYLYLLFALRMMELQSLVYVPPKLWYALLGVRLKEKRDAAEEARDPLP